MNPYGPQVVLPGRTLTYGRDGIVVSAESRSELIEVWKQALVANGKRIIDPEAEIDRHLASVGFQVPISTASIAEKPRPRATMIVRIKSWFNNLYTQFGPLKFVASEEARRRAAICVQCPKNKKWTCAACGRSANEEIERDLIQLSQGRKTPFDHKLHGCDMAGHENRLAIWLEEKFLSRRKNLIEKLPEACWMKTL